MTVEELIERLGEYDGDAKVRLMAQPNYPFEYGIRGLASTSEISGYHYEHNDGDASDEGTPEEIIYLVEGEQIGYGQKDAWDAAS